MKSGVMIFQETKIPSFLLHLIKPKVKNCISFSIGEDCFSFFIIEMSLKKNILDKKSIQNLEKFCIENDIELLYFDRNHLQIDGKMNIKIVGQEELENIKSIKAISSLIKVSEVIEQDKLNSRIGFVCKEVENHMLDTLSDDATSLIIYEGIEIDEKRKNEIFEQMMNQKGISTIFTKDINKIILNSDVIITDDEMELDQFNEKLKGKIILQSNRNLQKKVEGQFLSIKSINMWCNDIEKDKNKDMIQKFNDELLCLLREYYHKEKTIDFIRKLQYIYLLDCDLTVIDKIIM